jgi:hypothetical protein
LEIELENIILRRVTVFEFSDNQDPKRTWHGWRYAISYVAASQAFVCGNDDDAVVWAKQLMDGADIELWSGERFIIRLDHKKK